VFPSIVQDDVHVGNKLGLLDFSTFSSTFFLISIIVGLGFVL